MCKCYTNLYTLLKFLVHSWSHQLFFINLSIGIIIKGFCPRKVHVRISVLKSVHNTDRNGSLSGVRSHLRQWNESLLSLASYEVMTTFAWCSKHYQIWWIDAFTLDFSCKCQPWFIVTGKTSWLSAVLLLVFSWLANQWQMSLMLDWCELSQGLTAF